MIRKITSIIIFFSIVFVICSGCIKEKHSTESDSKIVNWNAQDLIDDFSFSTSMSGGIMKWSANYKSLNEADTLILTDKISNITYTSFLHNATSIFFDVKDYTKMGMNASEVAFLFQGNITDKYQIGDNVKITLTVKHFVYTNETSKTSFDWDVFEEGWDQEYFITHFFAQILPENCITKI